MAARRAAGVAGAGAAHLAAVLAPYVLWATFAYRRFCVDLGYTPAASGTATVASLPAASAAAAAAAAEWCHRPLPDLYAHVQSKYWGVGALRYYQWRQAPNFALAAPALGLCASACLAALAALRPTTAPPTAATSTGGGGDEQRLLSARRAAARFLPLTSRQPYSEQPLGTISGSALQPQPADGLEERAPSRPSCSCTRRAL